MVTKFINMVFLLKMTICATLKFARGSFLNGKLLIHIENAYASHFNYLKIINLHILIFAK